MTETYRLYIDGSEEGLLVYEESGNIPRIGEEVDLADKGMGFKVVDVVHRLNAVGGKKGYNSFSPHVFIESKEFREKKRLEKENSTKE